MADIEIEVVAKPAAGVETPAPTESEVDTAAQAVATAEAAAALAHVAAAGAEVDAASSVRELSERMHTQWQEAMAAISSLKADGETLSLQVQSLTSAMTQTAAVAVEAEAIATLTAEALLTDTSLTGASAKDGQEAPADQPPPEPKRGKKLFRI